MKRMKWHWAFDQWLEDKVWTKIPKQYHSPHFFFVLGFITDSLIFMLILI